MEYIGRANINDPFIQSMMDHNLKPVGVYYAGDYKLEQVVIENRMIAR